MASSVIHDDIELFLCDWYRAALAARPEPYCANVEVDRVEPQGTWPARMLIVRFDGSTRASIVSDEATIGMSVLAGSKLNPKEAVDLARVVRALLEQIPSGDPDNPVAALLDASGPVAVPEDQDRARQYITADLVVAGKPF